MSTPANLDPSDPSKIMCIVPKVRTERNSSVQVTFILIQNATTTLPLFKEYLQQTDYVQKQFGSERRTQESLPCFTGSQRVAPGLKYWSTLSYHQKTQGRRWAFQKPSPFHKKCLYKQIKPRQTSQLSTQLRDRCLSPPYPKE